MCLPLVPVIAGVAAVASLAGGVMAAQGAQTTAAYNAQIAQREGQAAQQQADFNAGAARTEAAQTRDQAAIEEGQIRERARLILGDQRARIGASGVVLEGSPLDALSYNAGQLELEALNARYTGDVRARSLENQARGYGYQGQVAQTGAQSRAGVALLTGETAARSAYAQGITGAAGSLNLLARR